MTRFLIVLMILMLTFLSGCNQRGDQPVVEDTTDAVSEQIPAELPDAESPDLSLCTEPRPEICAQNYAPVCGVHEDGSRRTYSNGCMACSNPEVVGSLPGACPE